MEMRQTRWGDIPARFFCTMTDQVMLDPVRDPQGTVYERTAMMGHGPTEALVSDEALKKEITLFLVHSPVGINIAIERNNYPPKQNQSDALEGNDDAAIELTENEAGLSPTSPPKPLPPTVPADETLAAEFEARHLLRGLGYKVEVLSWWEADGYNRRKMDDLDGCCGVTNPSCFSWLSSCGKSANTLPWLNFKFDFRDQSATLIQDVTQLSIGADIGVDEEFPGCTRRDHAIYIGRPGALPPDFHDRIPEFLVDVPCVVHLRRSKVNNAAAQFCISSLDAFREGRNPYQYNHDDKFIVMKTLARAMDCVTGQDCPYNWHHASSGHWASWCVEGRFHCEEAAKAQQSMFSTYNFAKYAGVVGVVAWAALRT